MPLMKCYYMLQNASVIAFTFPELFRKNQQEVKLPPPPIRVNKKVVGKIKDEFKRKIISEFIGLKSKTYSLINVDNEENKKAKAKCCLKHKT